MAHGTRYLMPLETEHRQKPRRLTDVPFHWVHTKRPVRDMGNAEVLTARQQVLDPDGNHGAERDLKRPAPKIKVTGAADARMKIDPLAADADGIVEVLGAIWSQGVGDVLLEHGELGPDTAGGPHVRRLSESIWSSSDHVAAKPQARIANPAVGPRRLCLKPVQQTQAELARGFEIAGPLSRISTQNRAEPVVVLGPVDDGHVAAREARLEVAPVENPAKGPPGLRVRGFEQPTRDGLVSLRFHGCPPKQRPRPAARPKLAPEAVLPRLVDRVILIR